MSSVTKWQEIRQQQGNANAKRWLNTLESDPHPSLLVRKEYDNLLRAIEYTLDSPAGFDLAYHLIHILHIYAISYADWERWLIYLQKAHRFSQLLQRPFEEATLLEMMGNVYRTQGELKQAETYLGQAATKYNQLSLLPEYAVSLSNLAVVLESLGEDGESVCQAALAMVEESQNGVARARILLNLSSIYMRRHEWQSGLQAAKTAYDLTHSWQDSVLNVKLHFNMLTCLGRLEKWAELNETFAQLADELDQRGDIHTLAKLRNNLGVIAYDFHNLPAAEQQWQAALKLQSAIQDPVETAFLYNNLGMVYTQLGELETAEEMLKKAVAIQEQLQDIYQWANAIDNLADVYAAKGETAAARHIRQQAHARLQTLSPTTPTQALVTALQAKLLIG